MTQKERQLSTNQKKALRAMMRASSVAEAARHCGLSERTLWRYLGDPDFKAALDERMDKETTGLAAALAGLSNDAIATLSEIMGDDDAPASVRARVALGVLKERRDVIELDALAQRIARLEETLA